MKKKIIVAFLIVSILLLASIISISGLYYIRENLNEFSYSLLFSDGKDTYVYSPVILSESNKTVIDVGEYYFTEGSGKITPITINGHKMLNISLYSDEVIIEYNSNTWVKSIEKYSYSNITSNSSYPSRTKYTSVFFSGNSTGCGCCYYRSIFSHNSGFRTDNISLGPTDLNISGWNRVFSSYKINLA